MKLNNLSKVFITKKIIRKYLKFLVNGTIMQQGQNNKNFMKSKLKLKKFILQSY